MIFMNEQVQQFLLGVGALTEMWIISYRGFIQQGLSDKEALEHTREFMRVVIGSANIN